ncbi:hypothetical protein [Rhodoferax sp.]|jgi:hypothetical protein|nr:hypothetical protein [Rhodoferax sp.]MDP1945305.1 hypothetical protein [Rhodoferax sp.]MDZ4207251.1 hypothetical protein [Rhodoferax sp.]
MAPFITKQPRQAIKTMIQIKSQKLFKQPIPSMHPRSAFPVQRHSRFTLGVCALILLGMLVGAFISSMGGVMSHGLAEFAAGQHNVDGNSVNAHGHSHDDDDAKPSFSDAGADHAHHGADHSHDKSHVPFSAMTIAISMAASRPVTARQWVELVEAFRLERPPMA